MPVIQVSKVLYVILWLYKHEVCEFEIITIADLHKDRFPKTRP
jgi:hypothetical protein